MIDVDPVLEQTRRHFFGNCAISLGSIAAATLGTNAAARAEKPAKDPNPLAPKPGHYAAKAKRVIFLFMAGGPSHLDLFDPKPTLEKMHGEVIPSSFTEGKRFAFIQGDAKLMGSPRKFRRHGQSGAELSELMPHLGSIADEIAIVRSMKTDVFNHGPAKVFINTGSPQFGRPSMGAWVTYGIGSESDNLPGFVVLNSGPRGPRGGTSLYSSGFLPTTYQGVPLRLQGEPILDLSDPRGFDRGRQRSVIDGIRRLNEQRLEQTGDQEIATRIAAYEMAFRMQTSAPELIDLSGESEETLKLYGADPNTPSFARNCLLARRLVERGTRFVQLYHTDWDHHGNANLDLNEGIEKTCRETDQACAALVKDLKERGLLEDTLVVWGGEFGRTPMGEFRDDVKMGRDHHIDAFTMWLAGGGVKGGQTLGKTDEIGYDVVEDAVHVHDLQATILHLLGLNHLELTYKFRGRDFRLTDVHGEIVEGLLA